MKTGRTQMKKTDRIIEVSREASRKSDCHIGMSAVIVNKSRVVSVGYNRKTFPRNGMNSIHAEVDALHRAPLKALKGATMFITRYGHKDRSGGSRLAAPCRECSEELRRAMQKSGLRSVYYTTTPENLDEQKVEWVEWSPTEQGYQRAKHSVRP